MPQYTVKLNTYDPAIVEAFERLRKNRKQTAFTHEALKYFLNSETGKRVINLMSRNSLSPPHIAPEVDVVEPTVRSIPKAQLLETEPPCDLSVDQYSGVLEKILG